MKKRLALLLIFLISYSSAWAHAVQVGYVILPNGFIRVYIEHWHGYQTTESLVNNGMSVTTTYGSAVVTQNVNPTGAFNNTSWNNLPGAGSNIIILSRGPSANQYQDWAYYDFAPAACNVPVNITLNGGLTVVLTEENTSVWPQTISGTFNDTSAPTITVSNTTATVSCGTAGANINFSATALDNCTQNPSVTFSIAPGSFFPVGTTNVTAYSTDANGNSGQLTFPVTVNVLDNVNPTLSLPSSFAVANSAGICGSVVTYTASATDDCSTATLTQIAGMPSGAIFPKGITTNTFKATDASGNSVNASFTVTVTDNQAPVITCPFNITVNANPSSCGAVVNYNQPSATDNCGSGNLTTSLPGYTYKGILGGHTYFVSNNQVAPEVAHAAAIALGGHLVTIANAAENSFVSGMNADRMWIGYTDRDIEGTYRWVTNEPVTYTNWSAGEPNNSGGSPGEDWAVINWVGPTWNDWYYSEPAYYVVEFEGGTTPTTLISGLASGSVFPVGTTIVTYRATDDSGNSTSCSFTVTVEDKVAPIVLTQNITIQLNASGSASITAAAINNGSTDNCGIASISLSKTAFDCSNFGANTVILTVTDIHGNVNSKTATVTIEDKVVPIVLTQNRTILLDEVGAASITAAAINNGSTDNCGIAAIVLSKTDFITENLGVNTVTLTVTDIHGNVNSHTATVTVEDHIVPTITAPNAVTVSCGASLLPGNTGMATATDNSTESAKILITYIDSALPSVCGGNFTRTWTAKDASNNSSSSEQVITINPAALPTMIAPNAVTISIACGSEPAPSTLPFTNGLSGGCLLSGTSLNSTFALVTSTCGGTYIETWTANDACGRAIAPVSRTVTVNQNMGAVESFVFFSAEGAVGNTGVSTITGDIGTSVGAITGFGSPSTVSGSTAYANAATTQAKKDLLNLYIHLSNVPVTVAAHAPVFGNGEILGAGVYSIGAAGSLVGTLTLDGQGNPNALFIFKYYGAFSAASSSKLILTNGIKASNVFWIAEGAISIGASSVMKGTFLAHTGAVSMGAGGDLEGRMISTTGAVTFDSGKAYLPGDLSMIPIICVNSSLSSNTLLGSAAKFALFTGAGAVSNLAISGIVGDVGTNAGAITGFESSATTLINDIYIADEITAQAKTDLDNAYQQLSLMPGISLTPTLAGLTLTPGVYSISGAGTLTDTITLDGQGDPNAEFVIKFGGAFTTGAQSKVSLINGASSSNVFWVTEGAISMGAFSFIKGTLIAHNGAISMGARGNLEGRMLSTNGAVNFNTAVAYTSYLKCVENSPMSTAKKSSTSKVANTPIKLETTTTLMAYPNPFTVNTTVSFTIPYEEANATVVIYDLKGTMIQSLYNGNANANQKYEVQFNGQNISTGTYFFRLTTSKEAKNFKVIVE